MSYSQPKLLFFHLTNLTIAVTDETQYYPLISPTYNIKKEKKGVVRNRQRAVIVEKRVIRETYIAREQRPFLVRDYVA